MVEACMLRKRDRQALRRRQDPGFRGLRRGRARQRFGQAEVGDVLRACPFGRIDAAIDLDGKGRRRC